MRAQTSKTFLYTITTKFFGFGSPVDVFVCHFHFFRATELIIYKYLAKMIFLKKMTLARTAARDAEVFPIPGPVSVAVHQLLTDMFFFSIFRVLALTNFIERVVNFMKIQASLIKM